MISLLAMLPPLASIVALLVLGQGGIGQFDECSNNKQHKCYCDAELDFNGDGLAYHPLVCTSLIVLHFLALLLDPFICKVFPWFPVL